MTYIRIALEPLVSTGTYRRWLYLVLGGVLFVPFALVVLVAISLVAHDGSPNVGVERSVSAAIGLVIAAGLGGSTALVHGVHAQQLELARSLLGGAVRETPSAPGTDTGSRARAVIWSSMHLLGGFIVSLATMIVLTEAGLLALAPVTAEPTTLFAGLWAVVGSPYAGGAWLAPLVAAMLVCALIYGVALVGTGAALLAPIMLAPSLAGRLAAAQARADDLAHRNRLATELHDSLGHALSVVALQAGAAERVIERDPAFARRALEVIAEQARTATAELDHVLGVLREEPPSTARVRTLEDLDSLVDAANATGTDVRFERSGALDRVPAVVSREAFRICQEGITNALRHGDDQGPILFHVQVHDTELRLEIVNRQPPVPGTRAQQGRGRGPGGRGLRSMRERVSMLGGTLSSDAHGDSWRTVAAIPLEAAP